jgi:hypothetical protein
LEEAETRSINYKYARFLTWISVPALVLVCLTAFILVMFIPGAIVSFIHEPNINGLLLYLAMVLIVSIALFLETCFIRIGYTTISTKQERIVWIIGSVFFLLMLAWWIYNLFTTTIVYTYQLVPIITTGYLAAGFVVSVLALINIHINNKQSLQLREAELRDNDNF